MNFSTLKKILLRLYIQYVYKHLYKLILALILSFGVAGGTAAIAWLLDPAVKKIFIEQDNTMLLLIPIAIVLAFCTKGLSLFFARTILIRIGNEVVKSLQMKLCRSSCMLIICLTASSSSEPFLAIIPVTNGLTLLVELSTLIS